MSHPRLSSSNQSWPWRLLLLAYEFCASLKLAVVLIFSSAFVLAWATFVEARFGTAAVQFGLYQTWWFELLHLLLAINIFCAAAIRFPWKRHQTGFVITHIGLLTLLFGCYLQRRDGVDAQMPVMEDQANSVAYDHAMDLLFEIEDQGAKSPRSTVSRAQPATGPTAAPAVASKEANVVGIPFRGGPFNWSFFDEPLVPKGDSEWRSDAPFEAFSRLAFRLANRDVGPLRDRSGELAKHGLRVEVLDYYSDCKEVSLPFLRVHINMPAMPRGPGKAPAAPTKFMPIELHADSDLSVPGEQSSTPAGGGTLRFLKSQSPQETAAFLDVPNDKLGFGRQGQLVLRAGDKNYRFLVDELFEGEPKPLGDTGITIERMEYVSAEQAAEVPQLERIKGWPLLKLLVKQGEESETHAFFAGAPNIPLPPNPQKLGVYGSLWFKAGELTVQQRMAGGRGQRIDFLQGHDQQLYYRYWNGEAIVAARPMPIDGTKVDAFKMPIAQLQMYVAPGDFLASDTPVILPIAKPFDKSLPEGSGRRAVKLKITAGDESQTLWVVGINILDDMLQQVARVNQNLHEQLLASWNIPERDPLQNPVVEIGGKRVSITLPAQTIDVGYHVRLGAFERLLDPGTNQASHFGSRIDLLNHDDPKKVEQADIHVAMNAPVDFRDPGTGRDYRLFQESFRDFQGVEDRFISVFTINYDPGQGVKYLGCGLVVAGIATMFYMRAYFFKAKGASASEQNAPEAALLTPPSEPAAPRLEKSGKKKKHLAKK